MDDAVFPPVSRGIGVLETTKMKERRRANRERSTGQQAGGGVQARRTCGFVRGGVAEWKRWKVEQIIKLYNVVLTIVVSTPYLKC